MKINIIFVLLSSILFAQNKWQDSTVYSRYVDGQQEYDGGNIKLYQDIHEIIQKKKLSPCKNKKELYVARIIVYPDRTIKFLKKQNIKSALRNKCAFELAQTVFPDLTGWIPAELNGNKVPAIQRIIIFPDSLFENYTEGYDPMNYYERTAVFSGGNDVFKEKFSQKVSIDGYKFERSGVFFLKFLVDARGKTSDFKVEPSSGNEFFDNMVINAAKSIRGTWKPASIHGVAVDSQIRIPLTITLE